MKRIIIALILLASVVSALQFSPTKLTFNIAKDKIVCKEIEVNSETFLSVKDSWASNFNEEWTLSKFQTNSQDIKINIRYPLSISSSQKEIEVCISTENAGNYKGALLFKQEQLGNSQIQFAVWLELHSEGKTIPIKTTSSKNYGGSSNSLDYTIEQPPQTEPQFQQISFNQPEEKIKLSSNKIPTNSNNTILLTPAILGIFLLLLLVINKTFNY